MVRSRALPFSILILFTLVLQLVTPGVAWAEGEAPPSEAQSASGDTGDGGMTVAEILTGAPDGTEVLVVDPAGSPEPLASQQAAEAVAESDPVWCPGSVPATDPTCTPPQGNVVALLNFLDVNPSYAGNGTIYFTTPYAVDDARISGGDLRVSELRELTIDGQGFAISVPIEITNWAYAVSLRNLNLDLELYGTSTAALRVEAAANIQLADVAVTNSKGDGAFLDNSSGTGSISVTDSTFNANAWTGLDARSSGDISLQAVVAGSQEDGAYLDASTGSGSITVDGGDFSYNSLAGLTAHTAEGDITLTNVVADANSLVPVGPTTLASPSTVAPGSSEAYGIGLTSTAGGAIDILGGSASGNEGKGLWIEGTGPVTLQGVTASNNGTHGAYVHNLGACEALPISVTVNGGTFQTNGGYGLLAVLGPAGTFNLTGSPFFAGNALGDYAINLDPCPACDKTGEGKPYNIVNVPETGGPPVLLDCTQYAGTVLILPNGDRSTLVCPVSGETTLTTVPGSALPGTLPPARTFVSGLSVGLTEDGQPVLTITEGGYLMVAFTIPEELKGASLAILYWDPTAQGGAGGWVELPPYAARPDGSPIVHRLHPDISPDDGMDILGGVRIYGDTAKVKVTFTGTFALVTR